MKTQVEETVVDALESVADAAREVSKNPQSVAALEKLRWVLAELDALESAAH